MDHNWHQASIIPTATLLQGIPDDVESSWLQGQLVCSLKDGVLEGSSAIRGAAEFTAAVKDERPIVIHKAVLWLNRSIRSTICTLLLTTPPHTPTADGRR